MVNYLGEEDMQNTYFFGGPSGRISNEYYRADIDTMEPVEPENVGTLSLKTVKQSLTLCDIF